LNEGKILGKCYKYILCPGYPSHFQIVLKG